ncbi:MAG: hypothetical protein H6706_20775 [Myxococcales bacterium]|nr:hypothetical protein [Myxococcales bacterium]
MVHVSRFGQVVLGFGLVFAGVVVAVTYASRSTLEDCGDVDAGADLGAWEHGARCRLAGTVGDAPVVTMGRVDTKAEGPQRFANVRFFARLGALPVVAILPGDRPEVYAWYRDHGDQLTGFRLAERGRLIDADRDVGYRGLGKGLRTKLGVAADARLWIFDTAPAD